MPRPHRPSRHARWSQSSEPPAELHSSGLISDARIASAKARLIEGDASGRPGRFRRDSLSVQGQRRRNEYIAPAGRIRQKGLSLASQFGAHEKAAIRLPLRTAPRCAAGRVEAPHETWWHATRRAALVVWQCSAQAWTPNQAVFLNRRPAAERLEPPSRDRWPNTRPLPAAGTSRRRAGRAARVSSRWWFRQDGVMDVVRAVLGWADRWQRRHRAAVSRTGL